jgi:hypothetical protein
MIIKLIQDCFKIESQTQIIEQIQLKINQTQLIKYKCEQLCNILYKRVNEANRELEHINLETKAMERHIRKEFAEAGEHLETLMKLFKLRKVNIYIQIHIQILY